MAEIRRLGVLGCGLMGHGITQVAAAAGLEVVVREVDEAPLARGIGKIEKQLARGVEKGRMGAEEAEAVRARITGTTEYGALADCDFVVEAITEDLGLKREMWAAVDPIVKPEAFFASNTSSLSVIEQAAGTTRPDRFLGLHFFNPVQVMKLVEVVRCVTSSDEAIETGVELGERMGKLPVRTKDQSGFIVNRILIPFMLDAIRAFEEGVGSVAEIDAAMKAGAAHPMGPLELLDLIGLDTIGATCDALFAEFRERRFAHPPILRKLLAAGWYGRKTGMGFYDYSGEQPVENPGLVRG